MKFFITGHTGFKGAWLTSLLINQGHSVSGLSLDPIPGALFSQAQMAPRLDHDFRRDIRDLDGVSDALMTVMPDVVVHLAAQPLVLESYRDPIGTTSTNVLGTVNLLEAVRRCPSVSAQLIITTDKVYRNVRKRAGYREDEPLGGEDPYSASKAAADLLTQSWLASFDGPPTAIARAGNVIGGGDASANRLLPDLVRAFAAGNTAAVRYPDAVRPWQHVLDCLAGYQALIGALESGSGQGTWNLGPGDAGFVPVREVADFAVQAWNERVPGNHASWLAQQGEHAAEAEILALDASKAEGQLHWRNKLSVHQAVDFTIEWEARALRGEDPWNLVTDQIEAFEALS